MARHVMAQRAGWHGGVRGCVAAVAFALLAAIVARPAQAGSDAARGVEPDGTPLVEYLVDVTRPQTQTIEVTMVLRGGPEVWGNELDVSMPVWRPGRYQVLDLAGGIQSIDAADGDGNPLHMRKFDRGTWRISFPGGAAAGRAVDVNEVRVRYTLYCNSLADRTRHVDESHAFLSGAAVFLYCPKMRGMPLRVRLEMPDDWRIACGLASDPAHGRGLLAPDYDVLVDSPIEAGRQQTVTFEADGKAHEVAMWVSGGGGISYDEERIKSDFKKIVDECVAIFGSTPYDRYVFLVHVAPGAGGGTEHLNSTIMQTNPGTFDSGKSYRGFLALVAHEYFHTWNVKQLRPEGLVPYDYQRENYTDLLWVAEGTTSYYDDLILERTGQSKESDYLETLAGQLGSYLDSPGRGVQSLEMSSFDSWIKFNRPAADGPNTTVSFYTVGAVASFVLDMEIRRRTDNADTLDEVLRVMYERYPLSGGGYSSADLIAVVEEITATEFQQWFDAHVFGTQEMDIPAALGVVGLEMVREPAKPDKESPKPARERTERAYTGIRVKDVAGLAQVSNVMTDGPAFEAGLIPGDDIVAINGVRVRAADFDARVDLLSPGDEVRVTLLRRDELREFMFTAGTKPLGSWKVKKLKEPTEAQKAALASWLKTPPPKDDVEPNPGSEEKKDGDSKPGSE